MSRNASLSRQNYGYLYSQPDPSHELIIRTTILELGIGIIEGGLQILHKPFLLGSPTHTC